MSNLIKVVDETLPPVFHLRIFTRQNKIENL